MKDLAKEQANYTAERAILDNIEVKSIENIDPKEIYKLVRKNDLRCLSTVYLSDNLKYRTNFSLLDKDVVSKLKEYEMDVIDKTNFTLPNYIKEIKDKMSTQIISVIMQKMEQIDNQNRFNVSQLKNTVTITQPDGSSVSYPSDEITESEMLITDSVEFEKLIKSKEEAYFQYKNTLNLSAAFNKVQNDGILEYCPFTEQDKFEMEQKFGNYYNRLGQLLIKEHKQPQDELAKLLNDIAKNTESAYVESTDLRSNNLVEVKEDDQLVFELDMRGKYDMDFSGHDRDVIVNLTDITSLIKITKKLDTELLLKLISENVTSIIYDQNNDYIKAKVINGQIISDKIEIF